MRTSTLISVTFLLIIIWSLSHSSELFAQINPQEESTQVTAIVADNQAPSTPVLISPADDSKLKTGLVTFVWQASTDNWLMDHYKLILNDSTKFDDIPLTDTSNSEYTLTYNSTTNYYTLVVATALSDGNYTWKITAQDYHDNQATSVSWDFSIDTQAPVFSITQIGDQEVEITTGNADSIPEDAIVLEENEPTLSGTGEANSTVILTITFEDGSEQEEAFTIASDGTWSITLDTIPRDEEIELDFLITDPSGNISILENIKLILYTPVIQIPIPGLPPQDPGKPPGVEIPIVPPGEYLPPIVRTVPKKSVFYIRNATVTIKERFISWYDSLLFAVTIPIILGIPLIKMCLLCGWHRRYLSVGLVKQIIWIILGIGKDNPQGIVVQLGSQEAVPYSLVLLSGRTTTGLITKKELICDSQGVFPQFTVPDGEYRFSIQHPQHFFPTLTKRPSHLDQLSYYTGAPFSLKNGGVLPPFVVPVEALEKQHNAWLYQVREAILLAPSLSWAFTGALVTLSLLYPSVINSSVTSLYALLYLGKLMRIHIKNTEVSVYHKTKSPLRNTVIGLAQKQTSKLLTLAQTDSDGRVLMRIPPDEYTVWCVDFKHRLTEGDNKTKTMFSTDGSTNLLVLLLN